tara:strand:+ start:1064 stop:1240 length:177 start_codon:yes stop_codon:yes gene_type:complete
MITIERKKDCSEIPKHSSHCGFSRENWNKLNEGKTVKVDEIPEAGKAFVQEVKSSKGK